MLLSFFGMVWLSVTCWICGAFTGPRHVAHSRLMARDKQEVGGDLSTRILFSVAELLGRLSTPRTAPYDDKQRQTDVAKSVSGMAEMLRAEYSELFWITGKMRMELWEDDCVFADPFSSFGGKGSTQRFKKNADALSGWVENSRGRVLGVSVDKTDQGEDVIKVAWSFSGNLKLPWRPVLAAAGETSHVLSTKTGKICQYLERWNSNPWQVVGRLFLPGKEVNRL
jgi:hypothetical protein